MATMGTLFILIMSFQAITASNNLTFLTEDRMVKVSTVLENDRISVVVPTNYSLAQIKIQVKAAAKHLKTIQTLVGDDIALQKEYYAPMATSMDLFNLAESCMTYAQAKAYPDANTVPGSSCTYTVQTISEAEFIDGLKEISDITKMTGNDWTLEILKASSSKKETLARLRSKFQFVAGYLETEACALLNVVNSLSIGDLPENIIGGITTVPCAAQFNIDSYMIRTFSNGASNIRCELEVGSPRAVMSYKTLIPLNYHGVQLYTKPNTLFAREEVSRRLKILDCKRRVEWDSTNAPMCKVKDVEAECENALDSDFIDEIIKKCRFTQTIPAPIVRLGDDGILVQSDKARVREGGKLLQKPAPIIVYSNHPVDIDLGGETYKFGNSVKIKYPMILFTKLTEIQIAAVVKKGIKDDFWKNLNYENYLGHASLIVQGTMLIMAGLMGIGLCCKKRSCCIDSRFDPTAPVIGYERERVQLARNLGNANFRENMRMLQLE